MARAARQSGADPDDEDYEEFEEMLEQAEGAQVRVAQTYTYLNVMVSFLTSISSSIFKEHKKTVNRFKKKIKKNPTLAK